MSEGSGSSSCKPQSVSSSVVNGPLVSEVDESPLQKAMDKNKESLKVKLMMRRPINQLVAQGIIPSLKTPPAFHEQRQKLERAKMGDILKAKIQQRPDREELVRQHILEADVANVDPSLAERQRMLKKARLADSLNDQLSHRPGPLELIKKNILHTDEPIERAVKEGVIPFKATSEGQSRKPQHPDHYITFEEDSQSSEGGGSPSNTPNNSLPALENFSSTVNQSNKTKELRSRDVLETAAASAGIVNVAVTIPTNAVVVTSPILQPVKSDKSQTLQTFAELCSSVVSPLSLGSSTSSLSPLSSIASPPAPLTPRPISLPSPAPGKADKNRKKPKTKTQPKTRTIKFHEYKGPPNAQKNTQANNSSTETSYELLLQQQQLFLQWQLEWQHKYPQIILPAAQKPSGENLTNLHNTLPTGGNNSGTTFLVTQHSKSSATTVQPGTPQSRPPSSPPQPDSQVSSPVATTSTNSSISPIKVLTKLEDMKVSDLKMELKRRNLPVSGPKPQLIERLKPFTKSGNSESSGQSESNGSVVVVTSGTRSLSTGDNPGSVLSDMEVTVSPMSPDACDDDEIQFSPEAKASSPQPVSPDPNAMDTSEPSVPASPNNGEIIIQQQQRKIEELQRELEKSQQQLQQIRQSKDTTVAGKASDETSTSCTASTNSFPVKALLQNGVLRIDPKSQQKLILQQHLQNKMQQHQLQIQLQQLQQQNSQQLNETVNAKASLAAFINQQQVQHQLSSILQAVNNMNNGNNNNSNNNNNNNNNNNSNNNNINNNSISKNKVNNNNGIDSGIINSNNGVISRNNTDSCKDSSSNCNNNNNNNNNSNNSVKNKVVGKREIILGQQEAAIVLNHLNFVKKNGISGHHKTSTLPSFLGAIVQNKIASDDKHGSQMGKMSLSKLKAKNSPPTKVNADDQGFVLTSKPPPQYEEATKSLPKQEISSDDLKKSKSVKSQIVDDVLEILIKNGELPPSAANDPSTPTTPGCIDSDKGLLYPPAPPPPPPPPPLPAPGFSVTLPTSITLTSHSQLQSQYTSPITTFPVGTPFTLTTQSVNPPTYTLTPSYVPSSSNGLTVSENDGIATNLTFSIANPSFISIDNNCNNNSNSNNNSTIINSGINYLDNVSFMSTETSDFDLNNSSDQNFHSNTFDYMLSSNDNMMSSSVNMLPSDYGSGDINLKELGLDLETLDSMDFSQLDCKMDSSEVEEMRPTKTTSDMSTVGVATAATALSSPSTLNKTDQLINNNPDLVKSDLMEPMEMDDNWLDSLMPLSENQSAAHSNQSPSGGCEFLHCNDAPYESLLGNSQDPFELFDIHDADFKLPSSSLSWDKVDFAT